jgi:SAM-dependent methyltransferase
MRPSVLEAPSFHDGAHTMINAYSQTWFDLFLETRPPAATEREVAFLARQLPNPPYTRLLDLCCGQGRHANVLALRSYEVVGVDRDAAALAVARRNAPSAVTYLQGDMRELEGVAGRFHGVLCLWQSFGYFDPATNRDVLRQAARKLEPGGRLILDVYNRPFWEAHQGTWQFERKGTAVRATQRMQGERLTVHLEYGDGSGSDTFEWQLFTAEEIGRLARACGLRTVLACSGFEEGRAVTAEEHAMQVVLEREG